VKNRVFLFFLFFSLLLASGCSFQRTLKHGDVEEKYAMAMKKYEQKDYSRALQLFDQLIGLTRATDRSQRIYYSYAYCYYYQKDYTLAAYYFKRYYENFPMSKDAEECHYMEAFCYYRSSPDYGLDQTSTNDALRELQAFINQYPHSPKVPECNELIDKLRAKLEKKAFRIAKLYYRMEDYLAAITVLNDIMKDFPDTRNREEILFLIFKSSHRYAMNSIEVRKKERHQKAIVSYNEFASQYPASPYLQEAMELAEKSKKELSQIQSATQKNSKPPIIIK
jgi:outer membrane protein assembly factor BamD